MPNESRPVNRDREAIEELHRKDAQATKTYDVETLISLLSDDVVALPPGSKPKIGIATAKSGLESGSKNAAFYDVLEYRQDWEEVTIEGTFAYEWGTFKSAVKSKADGKVESKTYNVMRVLRKTSDGSWKVHRTIWNESPAA
jgi:ketosteroid isomerase-like protein